MTKIEVLKEINKDRIHEEYIVLKQVIKALDNPLGVLPGDEIEVWDGVSWKLLTFDSYDSSNTDSWWCEGHWYTDARIPQTNIPVLTEDDVKLLQAIVHNALLGPDTNYQLKKILERKT